MTRSVHLRSVTGGKPTPVLRAARGLLDAQLQLIDEVTGFDVGGSWDARLAGLALMTEAEPQPIAILVVRLANVEGLRRTQGREAADELVREVAFCLRSSAPGRAWFGRVGEDFLVGIASSDAADAAAWADNVSRSTSCVGTSMILHTDQSSRRLDDEAERAVSRAVSISKHPARG